MSDSNHQFDKIVMKGIPFDIAVTFAVWIEVWIVVFKAHGSNSNRGNGFSLQLLLYGVYVTLFISALSVMFKRRSSNRANRTTISAWIFSVFIMLMFIVATLHVALALFRCLRAYILRVDPRGAFWYLWDLTRWDSAVTNALLCTMSWLGDILVIYRCYYVWNCNLLVILVPLLLFLATVGINAYTLYWFAHPSDTHIDINLVTSLLNSIYPLAFIQNVLTTGLITFKIWLQHKASSAAGVIDRGSRLSLIRVLLIIIESAMIYTFQIFVLIILYFKSNTFQFIVQSAIVPSIGIVFVLIAVRVHIAKSKSTLGTGLGTLPAWLDDGGSAFELTDQRSPTPIPAITFRVSANHFERDDEPDSPFDSSAYTHKSEQSSKAMHVV
ncbi:hypothetical protein JR316_0011606 [Psilocybe cubensis]|uniref:Uncharacterized protein n=2 Tax=Psilocybe cubensis TaxID=181762 RepID=A0ACB8GKX0_PSICU|nr:hypothetical protein JR316_0011606 [Psilocybe cubensis]KAH9476037.1 hypothetical protein JR316_0011606 [Psilocybe cubensis]